MHKHTQAAVAPVLQLTDQLPEQQQQKQADLLQKQIYKFIHHKDRYHHHHHHHLEIYSEPITYAAIGAVQKSYKYQQ